MMRSLTQSGPPTIAAAAATAMAARAMAMGMAMRLVILFPLYAPAPIPMMLLGTLMALTAWTGTAVGTFGWRLAGRIALTLSASIAARPLAVVSGCPLDPQHIIQLDILADEGVFGAKPTAPNVDVRSSPLPSSALLMSIAIMRPGG